MWEKARSLLALVLFFALSQHSCPAQTPDQGALLVQMRPGYTPFSIVREMEYLHGVTGWTVDSQVSEMLNAWLLLPAPGGATPSGHLQRLLWGQPDVVAVQKDHVLADRGSPVNNWPDDPLLDFQWQYLNNGQNSGLPGADLSAGEAWAITTGGLTPLGDTIVIAVIDGGLDAQHPDLAGNLWVNRAEIPGDGLDNDGNGYKDDYRGWNVYAQNDNLAGISTVHGTPVTGIMAAKGNNSTGVTGVNWNVQTLFVAGRGQESVLLQAFDYVWKARKAYNDSGGARGAFVVAVNCSWGVNYGQPADAPLWCAAFDSLGQVGILTVAATANEAVDVDIAGDLPTSCPSKYLVSVTSLDNRDERAANAAWGANSIDIGAYGQGVYTLKSGNAYGFVEGTSFAAPQVSGAIGLLYSAPCPNLTSYAYSSPSAAAVWIKDLLLESATPNADLSKGTVSGGRLDLYNMISHYEAQCAPCPAPLRPEFVSLAPDSQRVDLVWLSNYEKVNVKWRPAGQPGWNYLSDLGGPYIQGGLQPCTQYEWSARAHCGGADGWSNWSDILTFTTDGCCTAPAGLRLAAVDSFAVSLEWDSVTAAVTYPVWLREEGGAGMPLQSETTDLQLSGLSPCTAYTVELGSWCEGGGSAESAMLEFTTHGCGACMEKTYCQSRGLDAMEEWIASVSLGSWQHLSDGHSGYEDYTGSPEPAVLLPGATVPVTIVPGFSGWPYKQYFRVLIDYNGNGVFDLPEELAFEPPVALDIPASGNIQIPLSAVEGLTRMRVLMKFDSPNNQAPAPCEIFQFGQVEDYCVRISGESVRLQEPGQIRPLQIYPQPAGESVILYGLDMATRVVQIYDLSGKMVFQNGIRPDAYGRVQLDIAGLAPGAYAVHAIAPGGIVLAKLLKM